MWLIILFLVLFGILCYPSLLLAEMFLSPSSPNWLKENIRWFAFLVAFVLAIILGYGILLGLFLSGQLH
jgi:hypothetical protein